MLRGDTTSTTTATAAVPTTAPTATTTGGVRRDQKTGRCRAVVGGVRRDQKKEQRGDGLSHNLEGQIQARVRTSPFAQTKLKSSVT